MQVFKLCLKIMKKHLPEVIVYVIVFLSVSLIISSQLTKDGKEQASFTQVKSNIAFVAEESSPLINGFKEELGKVANIVEIPDNNEKLQDALYFREVSYIIRVPKSFTEKFMRGENVQLEKTVVPASISNAYIDLAVNQYFNTARLYAKELKGISQESLVSNVKKDLSLSTTVEFQKSEVQVADTSYTKNYFNYLAYSLLAILISGLCNILFVINDSELKRRNSCSPVRAGSASMQILLACTLLTLIVWIIMTGFCFLFNIENALSLNSVYFLLNSFVFSICAACISFLIGNLVKSRNAIAAMSNVVTLGTCFLSGVFVPQQFLGSNVLKIASFMPTYWYVKANEAISDLTQFNFSHLQDTLYFILIEAGFAAAFMAIALVVGKKRRLSC